MPSQVTTTSAGGAGGVKIDFRGHKSILEVKNQFCQSKIDFEGPVPLNGTESGFCKKVRSPLDKTQFETKDAPYGLCLRVQPL